SLRFESGDVYPPYSTLRSDPLGAMALYESLGHLRNISVERDFSTEDRLPEGRDITYLHLGGDPKRWRALPDDLFREIDQFVGRGGRLVVTLEPIASTSGIGQRSWSTGSTNSTSGSRKTGPSKSGSKQARKTGTNSPPSWQPTPANDDPYGPGVRTVPIS